MPPHWRCDGVTDCSGKLYWHLSVIIFIGNIGNSNPIDMKVVLRTKRRWSILKWNCDFEKSTDSKYTIKSRLNYIQWISFSSASHFNQKVMLESSSANFVQNLCLKKLFSEANRVIFEINEYKYSKISTNFLFVLFNNFLLFIDGSDEQDCSKYFLFNIIFANKTYEKFDSFAKLIRSVCFANSVLCQYKEMIARLLSLQL